jgi:hypothetical protein
VHDPVADMCLLRYMLMKVGCKGSIVVAVDAVNQLALNDVKQPRCFSVRLIRVRVSCKGLTATTVEPLQQPESNS